MRKLFHKFHQTMNIQQGAWNCIRIQWNNMLCVFDKTSIACSIGGSGRKCKKAAKDASIRFAPAYIIHYMLCYIMHQTLHPTICSGGSGKKCKKAEKDASIRFAALYIIQHSLMSHLSLLMRPSAKIDEASMAVIMFFFNN